MARRRVTVAGTVLDTNMICDLMRLDEWQWVDKTYGPLHVVEDVWLDELDDDFRGRLQPFVSVIQLTDEELHTSLRLRSTHGTAMSAHDRGTLAVAIHRSLRCASNDRPVHRACQRKGIETLRTLAVLSAANRAQVKSKAECLAMVDRLRVESTMRLAPEVLKTWAKTLE